LGDSGIDYRIISKYVLNKQDMSVFILFRTALVNLNVELWVLLKVRKLLTS
jgi:hypothetical protein